MTTYRRLGANLIKQNLQGWFTWGLGGVGWGGVGGREAPHREGYHTVMVKQLLHTYPGLYITKINLAPQSFLDAFENMGRPGYKDTRT